MSWSGGIFTRTNGVFSGASVWTSDKNAGTKITSAHHDTHDQDLAQGINATLNKAGQNSPTANIDWGGFIITNHGNGSASTDVAAFGQTVTSATINATSKVLTLVRAAGNITVDLTAITVAGDTSDFARKSLDNTYTGAQIFDGNVTLPSLGSFQTADPIVTWNWEVLQGSITLLQSDDLNHGLRFNIDGSYPAGAVLFVAGHRVWTDADFALPTAFLNTTDNAVITGAWAFTQPLQVGTSFTLAGTGYSWTTTVPGPNTWQLAGTGGAFLKISPDAAHTSKLELSTHTVWHNDSFRTNLSAAPTGGNDGDAAIVVTGADKGLWTRIGSTWTKIL